tara:strand:+ start:137 stop:712 length:576 start_codon:yes stop_codon:yes gene_type:complete
MNLQSIKHSKAFDEFRANKRLQWLTLLVLAILLASFIKSVSDSVQEIETTTSQQQAMVNRLKAAAAVELSDTKLNEARIAVAELIEQAPSASSSSIAEAQALTLAEKQFLVLLKRSRANLVGTETVQYGNETFWQIRIELSGQLKPKSVFTLLQYFDGGLIYQRLASFQFRPKVSNDMSMVVDFLFRQESS